MNILTIIFEASGTISEIGRVSREITLTIPPFVTNSDLDKCVEYGIQAFRSRLNMVSACEIT